MKTQHIAGVRTENLLCRVLRTLPVLLLFFAVLAPLHSQYSTEAFNLKKASDLYDERGFSKGQSITVDGSLAISNANGTVSYSYPLDAFTKKGYAFTVSLNYCGSVALTSFQKLSPGTAGGGGTTPDDWSKFTTNKPVWIIGLNGFAVQALSFAAEYLPPVSNGQPIWDYTKMPWLIEGYDYCNRMQVLHDSYDYDVIRLLRDDGSVLELRNGRFLGDAGTTPVMTGGLHPSMVTGCYFEDAVNPRGFAYVEFDTTAMNSSIDSARQLAVAAYGVNWPHAMAHTMPRRVRYYPGDGLEYVFVEHQIPFGWNHYHGDGSVTGGKTAGPTIFYLKEINDAVGPVLGLRYTRHEQPDDGRPGRALLRAIGEEMELRYSDQFVVVESRGRTTSLRLEKRMPLSDYVSLGGIGKRSYLPMISMILDPVGRRSYFAYEEYQRTFREYSHPHSSVTHLSVKGQRLKRVVHPGARFDLSYYAGGSNEIFGNLHMNGYATGMADWRLNNIATEMKKYRRDGTLLYTETYCYRGIDHMFSGNCGTTGLGTVYTLKDERTGLMKTVDYIFEKREIARDRTFGAPHPLSTPLVYTGITSVTETANGESTTVSTQYDSTGRRTIVVPKHVETVRSSGGQNYTTSITTYQYTTDTCYGFNGTADVRSLYARKIESKKEEIRNPANPSEILIEHHTDFLHLPFENTVLRRQGLVWDKLASYHRWDSLRKAGILDCRWEDMPADQQVFTTVEAMDPRPAPVFGLVREQYSMKNGIYLGGIVNDWHTAVAYTAPDTYHRGLLLRDSIIGHGRSVAVLKGQYTYNNRRLPVEQENAVGAVRTQEYQHPAGQNNATAARHDGTTVQETLYNRMWQLSVEKPSVEKAAVRNARTGSTDLLTQMYEWSFYGQQSGHRDYNGWYSRFDYDENGRLRTAWLPKDFMNPGGSCIENFDGERVYPLEYGVTDVRKVTMTESCNGSTPATVQIEQMPTVYPLYAGMIKYPSPCSGSGSGLAVGPGEPAGKARRDNPVVLATSGTVYTYLSEESSAVRLQFSTTGADNPIAQAVSLRSVKLRFYISAMRGSCFTMDVSVGKAGSTPKEIWSGKYTMNCKYTGDAQSAPTGKGARTLAGTDSVDYAFTIDLSDYIQDIEEAGEGYVEIRVPTAGARVDIVSMSEDKSPRFLLDGEFDIPHPLSDYTLHYRYSEYSDGMVDVSAKVDDKFTTMNTYDMACRLTRHTAISHLLAVDNLLRKTTLSIGNPAAPVRRDSTVMDYTGVGALRQTKDQEGWIDSVSYDAWGRPVRATHADGYYRSTSYQFGSPAALVGDNDQNFYGYCERTVTTTENGKLHVQYRDAFGRLRREMTDSADLRLTTKYEYDEQGRLATVVNPAGDTTRYWYDALGRVQYKYQPDMGYLSYAYDALGQVRFSQTQQQADSARLTFTEYDDLGRVTLVGEARLGGEPWGGGHGHEEFGGKQEQPLAFPPHPPLALNRLTDQLDATVLHDGSSGVPTVNPSVWWLPVRTLPGFWGQASLAETSCIPQPVMELPVLPLLRHPAVQWNDPGLPLADQMDFENISLYPENARIAIHYDDLPQPTGSVWAHFPARTQWDKLAPRGMVRNLKGREAAVAYRQHAGEPYHFTVMSYDERGRVEAVLHYNENLGFDAMYYSYNGQNQITSVRVADPLRQYTTWYGYDWNGRVDTVWTHLQASGSGIGVGTLHYPAPAVRPSAPDIVYSYTQRGQVSQMQYPVVNTSVQYFYTRRRFLDSLVATRNGTLLFRQNLSYTSAGNISQQQSQHSGQAELEQLYNYDGASRLKTWYNDRENRSYQHSYDAVGNRRWYRSSSNSSASGYFYTDATGPNRLTMVVDTLWGSVSGTTSYSYTADGAMQTRLRSDTWGSSSEEFVYSGVQGLLVRYERSSGGQSDEWRYRYSASGEREQKRLYTTVQQPLREWTYYLLGGDGRQHAVYRGYEAEQTSCGPYMLGGVFMMPKEYLSYGLGDVHALTTRPVDPYTSVREYKIQDHLGSTRVVLSDGGTVLGQYDYTPFGDILWQSALETRKMYIDKEEDRESGDYNFGVRQYDNRIGRFMAVDPLWEKFRAWSPYVYSYNNPLQYKDPNGDAAFLAIPAIWVAIEWGLIGGSAVAVGIATAQVIEQSNKPEASLEGQPQSSGKGQAQSTPASPPTPGGGDDNNNEERKFDKTTEKTIRNIEKKIKGIERQATEHMQKLADYMKNPYAHDNKNFLKNASETLKKQIVSNRIKELKKQIDNFRKQADAQRELLEKIKQGGGNGN